MKYKYVFLLYHSRIVDHDSDGEPISDTKDLGCYSSIKKAKQAKRFFETLQGFKLYPNDFEIHKKRVYYTDKFNKTGSVFSLEHEYEDPVNNFDVATDFDIFADKNQVESQLKYLLVEPPFSLYPEGFTISEKTIDDNSTIWTEGFDSW